MTKFAFTACVILVLCLDLSVEVRAADRCSVNEKWKFGNRQCERCYGACYDIGCGGPENHGCFCKQGFCRDRNECCVPCPRAETSAIDDGGEDAGGDGAVGFAADGGGNDAEAEDAGAGGVIYCPLGEEYAFWSPNCEKCRNCNKDCRDPKKWDCYCERGYCRDDRTQRCHRCAGDRCPKYEKRYFWHRSCDTCNPTCQTECTGVIKTLDCYCQKDYCRRTENGECRYCYASHMAAGDAGAIAAPTCDETEEFKFWNRDCERCGICWNPCKDKDLSLGCFCKRGYCRRGLLRTCQKCKRDENDEYRFGSTYCENCHQFGCWTYCKSNPWTLDYWCKRPKDGLPWCRDENGKCVECSAVTASGEATLV